MNGTERYAEQLRERNLSYEELMEERDSFLKQILSFEQKEKAGDRSGEEWTLQPDPESRYQIQLELLSILLHYMSERYNQDFIWEGKSMADPSRKSWKE